MTQNFQKKVCHNDVRIQTCSTFPLTLDSHKEEKNIIKLSADVSDNIYEICVHYF
jgi:hypothetical protein